MAFTTLYTVSLSILLLLQWDPTGASLELETCDSERRGVVIVPDADAFIHVALSISRPGDGYGCGDLSISSGIVQELMAMGMVAERLNQDSGKVDQLTVTESYIPGVKIGIIINDNCDQPFLSSAALLNIMPQMESKESWCRKNRTHAFLGVIGDDSSSFTVPLAKQLAMYGVGIVSPWATAVSLSDNSIYPTFMRTIPADNLQVKVMVDILKKLGWRYFGLIHQDDTWAEEIRDSLLKYAEEEGLCAGAVYRVPTDMESPQYQLAANQIVRAGVKGVIVVMWQSRTSVLMDYLEQVPGSGNLQYMFPESVAYHTEFANKHLYAKGSISISPKYTNIPELFEMWTTAASLTDIPDDVIFLEWYQKTYQCKIPSSGMSQFNSNPDCPGLSVKNITDDYVQSAYLESSVLTIYTYARALKNAHSAICGDRTTICQTLLNLMPKDFFDNYMKVLDFEFGAAERLPSLNSRRLRFDSNGDIVDNKFSVLSYNDKSGSFKYEEVGVYDFGNDNLQLDVADLLFYNEDRSALLGRSVDSPCPGIYCVGCMPYGDPSHIPNAYVEGDVIIAGLFPVHERGVQALQCGSLSLSGAQALEAFLFAVKTVNNNHDLNVRLGLVAIDQCMDDDLGAGYITDIHRRVITLTGSGGVEINPGNIITYFGTYSDQLSGVVDQLDLPLFTYDGILDGQPENIADAAISTDLQNSALLAILQTQSWRYVHIVYGGSDASGILIKSLREMARNNDICFLSENKLGSESINDEIINMIVADEASQVVVLIGDSEEQRQFFQAIGDSGHTGHLTTVAGLGFNQDITQDLGDAAKGTIALRVLNDESNLFKEYLDDIIPSGNENNPWISEWYESLFDCYLDDKNPGTYITACSNSPLSAAATFQQDVQSQQVINSVMALADGLHTTLQKYCGGNYKDVCLDFLRAPDHVTSLIENIKMAEFNTESGRQFRFIDGKLSWPLEIVNFDGSSINVVGEYQNTDKGREFSFTSTGLTYGTVDAPLTSCPGVCSKCLRTTSDADYLYTPGQFVIGSVQDLHDTGSYPYTCGATRQVHSYQSVEAIQYAVEMVNTGEAPVKLNNIHLGSLLVDGCSSALKSAQIVSSIHAGSLDITDGESKLDVDILTAWMVGNSDTALEISDIVNPLDVVEIGVTSLGDSVRDKERMKTFYNTLTTGEALYGAMLQLFKEIGWSVVQVVYRKGDYLDDSKRTFDKVIKENNVCVEKSIELNDSISYGDVFEILKSSSSGVVVIIAPIPDVMGLLHAKKSSSVQMEFIATEVLHGSDELSGSTDLTTIKLKTSRVDKFDSYLSLKFPDASSSAWFIDYYEYMHECDITGYTYNKACTNTDTRAITDSPKYSQDPLLVNNINAVYAFADALDRVFKNICGINYDGVCVDFLEKADLGMVVEEMSRVSFTDITGNPFYFEDNERDLGYEIIRYNSIGQTSNIGTFKDGKLSLAVIDVNQYYDVTAFQVRYVCDDSGQILYNPGDITIAGVFDIHKEGAAPSTCGQISNQGYQLMSAFDFAIKYVNDKNGIFGNKLNGVRLGSVVLDSCERADQAEDLVRRVQSQNEHPAAYIAAYQNEATRRIAEVLNAKQTSQISYGSTSSSLANQQMYPYLLRTVASDDSQAKAMIDLLTKEDVHYVQVVRSQSSDGEGAAHAFIEAAKNANGICVAQTVIMKSTGDMDLNAEAVVNQLSKKKDAKVVMLFLDTGHIRYFLTAVEPLIITKSYSLIASDTWYRHADVMTGVEQAAKGTITFGVETSDVVQGFDAYLISKDTGDGLAEGWLNEFYEYLDCSKVGSVQTCDLSKNSKYSQDDYVIYTINAVFAAAEGIHETLKLLCGTPYDKVCIDFSKYSDRELNDKIQKATFKDLAEQDFKFDKNRQGVRGYHIYQINDGEYQNIGSHNSVDGLATEEGSVIGLLPSDCSPSGACDECPQNLQRTQTLIAEVKSSVNGTGNELLSFFDIHKPDSNNPYKCGTMDIREGFQQYLAYYFAIQEADVGGLAVDTCGNPQRVRNHLFTILADGRLCDSTGNIRIDALPAYMTMGNENSLVATAILSPMTILTVSPSATAVELDDAEYFIRTVHTDQQVATGLMSIMDTLDWDHVAVVYTDNSYGLNALHSFVDHTVNGSNAVCIGTVKKVAVDATKGDMANIISEIDTMQTINVVVLFTTNSHTKMMLDAVSSVDKRGRFVFVGNDQWADSQWVVSDPSLADCAEGAITLREDLELSKDFIAFFTGLTVADHGTIPDDWFEEFWQHTFTCVLANATVKIQEYGDTCSSNSRLTEADINKSAYLSHTITATKMLAVENKNCKDGKCVYNKIVNSNDYDIKVNEDGNADIDFDILNYQINNSATTGHAYKQVGTYTSNDELSLPEENVKFYDANGGEREVTSTCGNVEQCDCVMGTGGDISPPQPSALTQVCYDINSRFDTTSGIVFTVLTALGILFTLLLFVFLVIMYPIKGGTSVIGYLLLVGVICVYAINFAFILEPRESVCGIRRLGLGVVYAICFACMLVKVLNTWRIGDELDVSFIGPSYTRLSHPCSLLLIALFLAFIQGLIGTEWLILQNPDYVSTSEGCVCTPEDRYEDDLVISCVYVMLLILLTFIFSAVTVDSKENHYEARWILITTCISIVVWIAWCILYVTLDVEPWHRDWVVIIANLVIATTILFLIYMRKLILLYRYREEMEDERHSKISLHNLTLNKDGSVSHINDGFDTSDGRHMSTHSPTGYIHVIDPHANGSGADIVY